MEFDLVVIGAGAAGLSAARTGRRLGASVALVSDGPWGGDCTHSGCIPSKTLIEAAAAGLDFRSAVARMRSTIERVAATEDPAALGRQGITALSATARLDGPKRLLIDGSPTAWSQLVIATGSRPALPAIPGLSDVDQLTSESVFGLTDRPASMVIVGGGPLGVELAQAFARFGTAVTLVEGADRILPRADPAASDVVAGALRADGVRVLTSSAVRKARSGPPGVVVTLDGSGVEVAAERFLLATGRRPGEDRLGATAAGIRLDARGWIVTDDRMRTSLPRIHAAGDVTGRHLSTHAADDMGRVAAGNAIRRVPIGRFRDRAIPSVVYTDPEVARVGLTEAEAAARNSEARVAELPLDEVDRALTAGRTDGYVKLVALPRRGIGNLAGGRLVGATIVAARAGEMISVPTLAIRTGMLPARLALTVQAYPTWSLAVRQAAAQLFVETGGRRSRPARAEGAR